MAATLLAKGVLRLSSETQYVRDKYCVGCCHRMHALVKVLVTRHWNMHVAIQLASDITHVILCIITYHVCVCA